MQAGGSTVRVEKLLAHPPARVWKAISRPEYLSEWLMPTADMAAEPGARFTFFRDLGEHACKGWDGVVHCEMLEVVEGQRLSYRWSTTGSAAIDTVLTMELVPEAGGTRLVIEQTGFEKTQVQNRNGAAHGWRHMADLLEELLGRL